MKAKFVPLLMLICSLKVFVPSERYDSASQTDLQASQMLFPFLAWAWLAKAKHHSCHTKNQLLPKPFTENKRVKVRRTTGHYAAKKKKKSVEITMQQGLDNN